MASTAPVSPFFGVAGNIAAIGAAYRWSTISALSDSVYLDDMAVQIRSTVAGALGVMCADGNTHVLNFLAGETRTGQFTQIRATGTVTIVAGNLEVAYQG